MYILSDGEEGIWSVGRQAIDESGGQTNKVMEAGRQEEIGADRQGDGGRQKIEDRGRQTR